MKGIQDTTSSTLRQLLGNGLRYTIPKFQRDYSWETEQWDDLWQDIEAVRQGEEPAHYLGYLVLQTDNDKHYKVIDGQQRMTTLSLLVIAVLKRLQDFIDTDQDADKNRIRQQTFRSAYIGALDPVTLISTNKLSLNRNNDEFYRQKIVPLSTLPKRGLNASEKLMRNCFEWFYKRLGQQFTTGESLASYLDELVDKLFFTVITVNNELNAFKVFETLNARGVQLSSADLLKNYLFSIVDAGGSHISEITEIESMWARTMAKLGSQKLPDFLRIYWNSRNKTVRKNHLFKAIRRSIRTKAEAFSLIRSMEQSADVYVALKSPQDELWSGEREISDHLESLKIFRVRQPIALLMAAYEELPLDQFRKVLRAVTVVSFRYNVIGGLNPNEQETAYNGIARRLRSGERFQEQMLLPVYPSDDSFKVEFTNAEFKRTAHKVASYILGKLEQQMHGARIDVQSPSITIEHILPESPDDGAWDHIADDALEQFVYRLGNLILLEKSLNEKCGSKDFETKKAFYKKSAVPSATAIAAYAHWDEQTISNRQWELARVATSVWRLNV